MVTMYNIMINGSTCRYYNNADYVFQSMITNPTDDFEVQM